MEDQKIYCANCLHCKVFIPPSGDSELLVRCIKGQWKNSFDSEDAFPLEKVLSCRMPECAHYEGMGEDDCEEFIAELRATFEPKSWEESSPPTVRDVFESELMV